MNKPSKKKLTLAIAGSILAVLLISFWILLIFITVNRVDTGGYEKAASARYIAHRGYSAKYYQNTVQAFEAAAEEDFFDAIETDVWMTKDKVFVCSHDVNPFVDKKVKITDCTYEEIKDLPLRISDEEYDVDKTIDYRIATLSEYLEICLGSKKLAFIEIKQDFNKEEVESLVDLAYEYLYRTRVYFCSFNRKVIEMVLDYKPLSYVELFASVAVTAFAYSEMGYNVGLSARLSKTDFFIKIAHKKNSFFCVWTVNDKKLAAELVENGVDFITTDTVLA